MPQITFDIPDTQVQRLKDFVDSIHPSLPEDPPRTNAEYLQLFKDWLRETIKKAVKQSEWKQISADTYNAIADMEVNDV